MFFWSFRAPPRRLKRSGRRWRWVGAGGPDWEPEVFVPEHHPERPERFADGYLGVLQRGYYHEELVVAYRYLPGGKLSEAEKAVYPAAIQDSDQPYGWDDRPFSG